MRFLGPLAAGLAGLSFACTSAQSPAIPQAADASNADAALGKLAGAETSATATVAAGSCQDGGQPGCSGQFFVQLLGTAKPLTNGGTLYLGGAGKKLAVDAVFRTGNAAKGPNSGAVVVGSVDVTGAGWSCAKSVGSAQSCGAWTGKWPALLPADWPFATKLGVHDDSFAIHVAADATETAQLCVTVAGDPQWAALPFCAALKRTSGPPVATFSPGMVAFDGNLWQQAQNRAVVIGNTGASALHVTGAKIVGGCSGCSLLQNGAPLAKEVEIPAGNNVQLTLNRQAGSQDLAPAELKLQTDDPALPKGELVVPIAVTPPSHCLEVAPKTIALAAEEGQKAAAQVSISNVCPAAVPLQQVALAGDNTAVFAIGWNATPTPPKANSPFVLESLGQVQFAVNFLPTAAGGFAGTVTVATANEKVGVPIQATATAKKLCPKAVIELDTGDVVPPQSLFKVSGKKSVSPTGAAIAKYHWTAIQPPGAGAKFQPDADAPEVTLLANATGAYKVCLNVWDANGLAACAIECTDVVVVPDTALHVELLWDTPQDIDQFDAGPAAGSDLDLHFAEPSAATLDLDCDGTPDPWFGNPGDTFWFNANPEWGDPNSSLDNATLDLDDTDGAGPENLNLQQPQGTDDKPFAYSVGVHYWNDHGFGASYANLKIFIFGALITQYTKVKLLPLDMWYVGKLNWPNAAQGGKAKVLTTCYQSGSSCAQKQNLMWQATGDWCIRSCYVNNIFNGSVGGAATGKCSP